MTDTITQLEALAGERRALADAEKVLRDRIHAAVVEARADDVSVLEISWALRVSTQAIYAMLKEEE